MNEAEIYEKRYNFKKITINSKLYADLYFDSIDIIMFIVDVEDCFKIVFDEDKFDYNTTVKEVVDYIKKELDK